MSAAGSRAAAHDAAVQLDPDVQRRKDAAAVDYYRREVAAAEDAVGRLEDKAARLRKQADAAGSAVKAAKADADAAKKRLADAETVMNGAVG